MRSNDVLRCGVLVLAALLAIDATWCCDDPFAAHAPSAPLVTSADDDRGDDATSLDCHACICSGLALIETTPPHAPRMEGTNLPMETASPPMSVVTSVDIPPDERG